MSPTSHHAPSLKRRAASWLYEGLLLFGLMAITALIVSPAIQFLTGQTHALYVRHTLQICIFLVFGIYFVWCWSKGQTLPMKSWRFKLTDAFGNPISKALAAKRYVLSWLVVLPPLLAMQLTTLSRPVLYGGLVAWLMVYLFATKLDPDHQFLHDRLSGTRLVTIEE